MRSSHAAAGILLVTLTTTLHAQLPADALHKVPDWANALLIVDYQGILASPFAQREGWDRLPPQETLGSSLPFLKNTIRVIQASNLEPGTFRSQRDLLLVQGGPFAALTELAKQEKAAEEMLGNVSVLLTPKNSYIVSMNKNELAVLSPANRQDTSRWLRFAQDNKTPVLPSYLEQASGAMNDGYHLVIAIDLHDTVDPPLVRKFLQSTPLLKGKTVNIDALVKVLTSSRGVRIGVRFDQGIQATFAADFSENIQGVSSVLPMLVLHTLNVMGADLEEFPANGAVAEDKRFLISSKLTISGLRKLLQLMPPVSGPVLAPRDVAFKGVPADNVVHSNQKYFKNIRDLANDAHLKADEKNDMVLAAQGYEKAASRIDQLPVGNIDESLVKFSTFTSSRLRAISDALRTAVLETNAVEGGRRKDVTVIPGYQYGYILGPWNPRNPGDPTAPQGLYYYPLMTPPTVNVRTNDADIQRKQNIIITDALKKRLELWRQFSDESANLRKQLTIRYKVEF
ncbi:MAG: hypothetical protein U0796_01810 [Gemmatales bacterium]